LRAKRKFEAFAIFGAYGGAGDAGGESGHKVDGHVCCPGEALETKGHSKEE
jgi:hypothetical protein